MRCLCFKLFALRQTVKLQYLNKIVINLIPTEIYTTECGRLSLMILSRNINDRHCLSYSIKGKDSD